MATNRDNMDISGKVALVTGGANGIGKAIVEILLRKEAQGVGIVDIDPIKGQEVTASLQKTFGDGRIVFVKCDVTSDKELKSTFEDVKKKFGRLDIVCNNAGISNEYQPAKTIATNLTSVITGTYLAVELMGTQNGGNGGVVINTASAAGLITNPYGPVYTATKHGVVGFSRAAAKEPKIVENGVRVSTICPEFVDTSFVTNAEDGVRYKAEIRKQIETLNLMPPTGVAEVVIKLIEDPQYNGCAIFVYENNSMMVVEEPDIPILRKAGKISKLPPSSSQ
ncbi:15-hydroxyprostaglandin dehydrogenase [NAD(+)]-like [Ptychodera flava]|uniref:15-hydroxyprostaglandin dehydrogenase [NAD(+)]-like n=1 Tax=Ptychodera flava TaxID=63121 RepID=UPI00396A8A5E